MVIKFNLSSMKNKLDDSENGDSRMHKFESISLSDIVPANSTKAVVTLGAVQNCSESAETTCGATYVFFDNVNLNLK